MAADTLTEPVRERTRGRRLLGPVATLVGAAVATCYVAVFDPNLGGPYPVCPSRVLLGIDCPGCGGLRATHALTHGDIAAAADNNLLLVIALPIVIVAFVLWCIRAWRGGAPRPWQPRTRSVVLVATVGVVIAFTVARNVMPYLGSGIG